MGYSLPLRFPGIIAASSGVVAPPADAEVELFQTTDFDLTAQSSPGNHHFDLFATYTATHTDSTTVSCITYYTGSGSAHKLRFGGLKVGRWTITTASSDAGLDGREFVVDVVPSTNASRIGFRTDIPGHKNQWARLRPDGAAELFIPHDLMFGHPSETGGWPNLSANLDTFMGAHGFTGLHIMGVAAGWFNTGASWDTHVTTSMLFPAPLTFARMENMLAAVRDRGGHVHIWLWGDSQRNLSANQLSGGKRGTVELRLRRYIAGRLGPIAGWSMGYGFDLSEWANVNDVSLLVSDFEGWCSYGHWYGGRYDEGGNPGNINNGILTAGAQTWAGSYYGWEFWSNHAADYSTHAERSAFRDHQNLVDQSHFAEDRYRRRSDLNNKNFRDADGEDAAIPILWQHTMAGISAIWGKMESGEDGIVSSSWDNVAKWKAHGDFWHGAVNRFDLVRVPADSLGGGGTLVRRAADFTHFAAWEGPGAGNLQVDYSGSPGNVDIYRANVNVSPLNLQLIFSDRTPRSEVISMPSVGNWVLWIEPTGGGAADPALSASPLSAAPSSSVNVTVSNGPGNLRDWVGLYAVGSTTLLDWQYLNGTQTAPTTPITGAVLTFTMPATAGDYVFRFFPDDQGSPLLAESQVVTVVAAGGLAEVAAVTVNNSGGTNAPSLTTSHNHPSGANRLLAFVGVSKGSTGAFTSVGATYGGPGMTLVDSIEIDGTSSRTGEYLFDLADPPSGVNDLVVSTNPGSRTTVRIYSVSNVDSLGTPATGTDSIEGAATVQLSVPSVADDLVLRGVHWRNSGSAITFPGDQTGVDDQGVGGQNSRAGASWKRATGGPTTMPADLSDGGVANRAVKVGVAVKPGAAASVPQCAAGLATGLVAYFKLDETSGTTATDSAGANNGTLNNMDPATDWVAGKLNGGLDFDGVNDFVDVANEANFDFNVGDTFSIFCWMKLRTQEVASSDTLVSKGVISANDYVGYELVAHNDGNADRQIMAILTSVWPAAIQVMGGTVGLDDNAWHHVGFTYNGSGEAAGVTLYVDGAAETMSISKDTVGASILNNDQVRLGARGDLDKPFNGVLDDVRIYNRELTAAEVSGLYNSGSGCVS